MYPFTDAMRHRPIYFDNAATSGKKPDTVVDAVCDALKYASANPGRSGHALSVKASEIIYNAREAIGEFFRFHKTENIVLTKNATEALNIALYGSLRAGDEVIVTSMEHNSVMRPLHHLERSGMIKLKMVQADDNGRVAPAQIHTEITEKTKLVVVTAASNVTGTIMPIEEIFELTSAAGVKLLVDAAQGAGTVKIDMENTPFDLVVLTGHKHLYGPQGTGALLARDPNTLEPFMRGGTGSRSEEIRHPDFPPDKFEAGTLNTPGFAGLTAGIRFIVKEGLDAMIRYEQDLTEYLMEKLRLIEEIRLLAPNANRVSIVSFTVEGTSPSDVADYLDKEWGIYVRAGLHCAPMAHKTMKTFPAGTVRFSLSYFNTKDEVDRSIEALKAFVMWKR